MIAVIADDFTGAAEIGGIGLRYGLSVLIETDVNTPKDVDVLVIATDTRSLNEKAATDEVARISVLLMKLNPDFIFKKIDSVLRGHVKKEIEAQLLTTGKNRALIVAGNPSVGRTIVNGRYFIDNIPLDETYFADDPDFPVQSSVITEIIASSELPVRSVKLSDELDAPGLFFADVANPEDLSAWAGRISPEFLLAGSSGFFDTILGRFYKPDLSDPRTDLSFSESSLFIFGSKYPKPAGLFDKLHMNRVVRINMPEDIYYGTGSLPDLMEGWENEVTGHLRTGNSVMITIDHEPTDEKNLSGRLREHIGQLVSAVETKFELHDLLIEGGATTSVVLKYLQIKRLIPFREADFGVIQMKTDINPNLCITTKPGSYLWPENLGLKNMKTNKTT